MAQVFMTECPEALKETQGTDPNQWPCLIFSSSTTGLLKQAAMVLSRQTSNANTLSTCTGICNDIFNTILLQHLKIRLYLHFIFVNSNGFTHINLPIYVATKKTFQNLF